MTTSAILGAKPLLSAHHRIRAVHTPVINPSSSTSMATPSPKWAQKTITLSPHPRGCHLITSKVIVIIGYPSTGNQLGSSHPYTDYEGNWGRLVWLQLWLAHLFLQHTSASLTINETYDDDVRKDTETFLNKVVPEGSSAPWRHTLEGPDDMPAHIKSSMFGCALTIPVTNGKLNMGTWQGIWLCEHRDYPTPRKVVVTLNGM